MANNNNIARDDKITGEYPGKLLADIRKKINLSEREVADALKISVSRLKSIESSEFSVFPSETYIRGHLRNYSRFLKCDELQILSAYDNTKPEVSSSDLPDKREEALLSNNKQKKRWMVYIVVVFLILAWVLSYWVFGAKDQSLSPSSINIGSDLTVVDTPVAKLNDKDEPQNLSQVIVDEAQPLKDELADAKDEIEFVSDGFSPSGSISDSTSNVFQVSSEVSNDSNDNVEQASAGRQLTASELVESIRRNVDNSAAVEVAAVEGDTLEFTFVNLSWVQVTDTTGAVLFKGTNKPGAELELNGKAPFTVVIGNVDGTSLVYNGESVSLNAPVGKNALRITLGS